MAVMLRLYETGQQWYRVTFPFDRFTINTLKEIPGAKFIPESKEWKVPHHAIPGLQHAGLRFEITSRSMRVPPQPIPELMQGLRPYQQEGVHYMLHNSGFILAFHPRVGKTPTASVALGTLLASGTVKTAVVVYMNQIMEEWTRQYPQFTMGLPIYPVTGKFDFGAYAHAPYLTLGVHYELLRQSGGGKGENGFEASPVVQQLFQLLRKRGEYAVAADEPQYVRNRKSPRAQFFMELGKHALYRYALTGTPMRSRPRDMYPMLEFISPGGWGSYSKFTKRYAAGEMGDHGWVDKGRSNEDELRARLQVLWFEKSRRDVAPWLPKMDRRVFLCEMNAADAAKYAKAEMAIGHEFVEGMNAEDKAKPQAIAAMRQLADMTSNAKMSTMLERVRFHCDRRVKVLVFALHHETLNKAWDTLDRASKARSEPFQTPVYVAGGWLQPEKRREAIAAWKKHPSAAVLLVNTLSSGIGIDLADAEVAVGLETSWVPSDFIQMEARIEDVHLGKRKTPPIIEYLLTRHTVDEDMATKLIEKLAAAEAVTGMDSQRDEVATMLRNSDVVDRNILTLAREDDETVAAAIANLRDRLKSDDESLYGGNDNEDVEEVEEDDEEDEETHDH